MLPPEMNEPLRVLYVVEGCTDIRFVVGLSKICRLVLMVPQQAFRASGLAQRVQEAGVAAEVIEIPGGRAAFQWRSLVAIWRQAGAVDLILSQELLRGSLSAGVVGRLRSVPVVTHTAIPALEYFQCRRQRRQIGALQGWLGSALIRTLHWLNVRLAGRRLALGPYLLEDLSRWGRPVGLYHYYGVDTEYFRPADPERRSTSRANLKLPVESFLALFPSRVSHEKDPETVLKAAELARARGLDLAVLNLGGGYENFQRLARAMFPNQPLPWVLGRPAVHPMRELAAYYQASDAVVQASLAEGAGLAPLEALACGIPVIATAVGGLKAILAGRARLTPPQDARAMAEQFLWIAAHQEEARAEALRAREFVIREWASDRAFAELAELFREVVATSQAKP